MLVLSGRHPEKGTFEVHHDGEDFGVFYTLVDNVRRERWFTQYERALELLAELELFSKVNKDEL